MCSSSSSSSVTYPGLNQDVPRIQPRLSDLVPDILVRLPIKSLLRFKSVSRFWNSLISSTNFINSHLEISKKDTSFAHHSIITTTLTDINIYVYSLRAIFNEQSSSSSSILHDFSCAICDHPVDIVGCFNGLCCISVGGRYVLWNPTIRKFSALPVLEKMSSLNRGFGFDGSEDGYKILHTSFGVSAEEHTPNVYSFKTNTWTVAENFSDCYRCGGAGVLVNRKLHWLEMNGTDIVSFDLESEVGGLIARPRYSHEGLKFNISLGELGGSLCFVVDSPVIRTDFWVLKDSWVKLVTIPNVASPMELGWKKVQPLCVSEEDEILFVYGADFVIYEQNGNSRYPRLSNLPKLSETDAFVLGLDVHVNVQSLVSPFPRGEQNE